MPGFNNYANYGNYGTYQSPTIPNNVRQTVPANNGNYAYNTGMNGNYMNNGFPTNPVPVQDDRWVFTDYVSGRAGADAYQMPNGVNKVLLFDNDVNRMYIKSYDNNGRPRVLEDNDFQPHVEPEPQAIMPNVDMSKYATKDDIEQLFKKIPMPNMSGYMTKQEFDTALTELFVDNRGRIVRNNESDA